VSKATVNEAIEWLKTLQARHAELVGLRNQNSSSETRRYGIGGDKEVTKEPTYSVTKLDRLITQVAKETRKCSLAIKASNAVTELSGYTIDEELLGEVVV
jgi:hypothetical protein